MFTALVRCTPSHAFQHNQACRRTWKSLRLTWKMVFSSGLPAPVSRPMSLAHMLTSTMSATASANSADCGRGSGAMTGVTLRAAAQSESRKVRAAK